VHSALKPRILHQVALLVVAMGLSNDSYCYNEWTKWAFLCKGLQWYEISKKVGCNIWYFSLWNMLMSQMLLYFVIVIVFIVLLSSMNIFAIIYFALLEICCATFVGVKLYIIFYFSYSSFTFLYVFIFIFMCWFFPLTITKFLPFFHR
jgi:hypothetical protein